MSRRVKLGVLTLSVLTVALACSLSSVLSSNDQTTQEPSESQIQTAAVELLTAAVTSVSPSLPTETIPPPTEIPTTQPATLSEPIVITGNGDRVVDVQKGIEPAIIQITGNAGGRYFGVTNYGSDNQQIDLLVNTTDVYDGFRPLDFYDDDHTTRLQIEAVGDWKIEILPLLAARVLSVPGNIQGSGDDVFLLTGANPDLANITGNSGGRYFGVFSYGLSGGDLLVNTTDPYDGTVIVDRDSLVIEVQAIGTWSIDISAAQ